MRVTVVAEYYPRPDDPVSGVWAHRQALAARDAGADVRVLVLDRPVPGTASVKGLARGRAGKLFGELRAALARPRATTLDGIDVEYIRYLSPPRSMSYARWHRWARRPLARALGRGPKPDLVHAHYAHLAGAAALGWTKPRGIPLAVSVHGGDVIVPALAETSAPILRSAAVVMCNSQGTLARAAAVAGGDDHMRVVHLGTDIPAELREKHFRPTIATLANADPRKRHEDVLRALAILPRDYAWTVIGDGPALERLEALAHELDLAGRVTFAGRLPPAEAHRELGRAHVMALPSEDEAFGVAYIEALAHGVPAIGVQGESGPDEIAALTDAMLLVPRRDPPALAAAIERAVTDGGLPERARQAAREHFSWERCGAQTVAAYEAALGA